MTYLYDFGDCLNALFASIEAGRANHVAQNCS